MSDESETCPRCKTSKRNKPSMRLMINICAHILCESCVEQLFFRGTAPCPKCSIMLKKAEFREQVFEDTYVEKEIAIRKKHIKELARSENEFPTLREFNDYLETVETLIFNLTNHIEEDETLKKIEQLKKAAKESAKNKDRFIMEKKKENPVYAYKPLIILNNGPSLPSLEDILENYSSNLFVHPAQLASGFPLHVPVQRLLLDAFSDLYTSVIVPVK